jgi:hypothetical protein
VRAHPLTRAAARVTALAGGLALVAAALVTAQLAGAGPAGAVGGLVHVHNTTSFDSQSAKSVRVDCPAGKKVVGGGAGVSANPINNEVRLVELRPVHPGSGPDGYVATAQEVGAADLGDWDLEVDAVCADPIPGMYLAGGSSGPARSTTVQSAEARCVAGTVALGGGGLVRNSGFQADLRTVAPSTSGDRFAVQGGEDVDGYAKTWSVVAYAICAPRPPGYQVVVQPTGGDGTQPRKATSAFCPAGTLPHGVGAATDPSAPGGVGLENIFVQPLPLSGTQALAVMTEPSTVNWGVFRVFAICAT